MFAKARGDGHYDILYIGKASEISDRVTQHHEKFRPANSMGMTTLGELCCDNDTVASVIERDLISCHNPPLNSTFRTDRF